MAEEKHRTFTKYRPQMLLLLKVGILYFLAKLIFGGKDVEDFSSAILSSDCSLAYEESEGFFADMRESDWNMLKQRISITPNCKGSCNSEKPHLWYQNNWEPSFTCLHERRIGRWGDGGKWVCDPHRIVVKQDKSCLVYSVGSNNDFTFEEAVLKYISMDCEIHIFDPTIGEHPSEKPNYENVVFHPWGLADNDQGTNKTLATITNQLGHKGREIDIFKIDCEGCEWSTFTGWFEQGVMFRQLLIELHNGTDGDNPPMASQFMTYLQKKGYVIFHKEPNTLGCQGKCIEYSFVRLNIGADKGRK